MNTFNDQHQSWPHGPHNAFVAVSSLVGWEAFPWDPRLPHWDGYKLDLKYLWWAGPLVVSGWVWAMRGQCRGRAYLLWPGARQLHPSEDDVGNGSFCWSPGPFFFFFVILPSGHFWLHFNFPRLFVVRSFLIFPSCGLNAFLIVRCFVSLWS